MRRILRAGEALLGIGASILVAAVGAIGAALVFTGCGGAEEAPWPDTSTTIRLADLLPDAEIESILQSVDAVSSIGDLEPDHLEPIWQTSFGAGEPIPTLGGPCSVESEKKIGRALLCMNGGRAVVSIHVEPSQGYRVRVRGFDVSHSYVAKIVELADDTPLRIFQMSEFENRPETISLSLFTTSATSELELEIEPWRNDGKVWVQRVEFDHIPMSPSDELGILKGRATRTDLDQGMGMLKRGRLLPLDDPETTAMPKAGNYVLRDILFAPAPTDIRFRLQLPKRARLSLGYALAEESVPGDSVRFRVLLQAEGSASEAVVDETVTLEGGEDRIWLRREVGLESWGGQQVELTLETRNLARGHRAFALWGAPELYVPPSPSAPPNVILIAADTLRADRLSCYGYQRSRTPAIESLAEDGVLFERAIAPSNWTRPSFHGLFAGRSSLDIHKSLSSYSRPVLAELFRAAGWATGAIVYKNALYNHAFDRGFDYFLNMPRVDVRGEENLRAALDWLRNHRDRRFFLFVHFNDPHQPFCHPPRYSRPEVMRSLRFYGLKLPFRMSTNQNAITFDPAQPTFRSKPCKNCRAGGKLTADFREFVGYVYDDSVHYMDVQIGKLLDFLKDEELYEDTIIAFTSDHGETLWNHFDQFGHGEQNLHEELIRVPLIVKPAEGSGVRWRPGTRVQRPVPMIDLMPTLLDLAHVFGGPSDLEATTLVPLLTDPAGQQAERPAISTAYRSNVVALRAGDWKYIRYFAGGAESRPAGREELFELGADPGEMHDVKEQHHEVLDRLRLMVDDYLLWSRQGASLLVQVDDPRRDYRIRLVFDARVQMARFGFPDHEWVGSRSSSAWEFSLEASDSNTLVVPFRRLPAGVVADVSISREGTAGPVFETRIGPESVRAAYEKGSVLGTARDGGFRVELLCAPSSLVEESVEAPRAIDVRQMERLRALGYLGS